MLKKLLILTLVLFSSATFSYAREVFEKGDAIYSDLGDQDNPAWFVGHTGLYLEWDQSGDPNDYSCHKCIESTKGPGGQNLGVQEISFSTFHSAGSFWSVRYKDLSYDKRNRIMQIARRQRDLGCDYNFFAGYKSPGVSFRCDGLVEYCYEQVGIDIVPNDTWIYPAPPGFITLLPLLQMNCMTPRTSAEVTDVELIAPSVKNAKHPYYRGAIDLRALVGDSNNGSGVAKVKFYNGTPPNDSNYISQDDHDETLSGLYKTTWQTTQDDDGRHNICFKSYDQAGNSRDDLIEIIVDNTPPFAVIKLDSSRKISTWSNNAKVTTTWTAAKDDTHYTSDVSGIDGYGAVWNTTAVSLPPEKKTIEAVTAATNETPLPDGKSHYFHIRSVDKAGNWGKEAVHMGPFWVDATKPNISIAVLWEEMDSKNF